MAGDENKKIDGSAEFIMGTPISRIPTGEQSPSEAQNEIQRTMESIAGNPDLLRELLRETPKVSDAIPGVTPLQGSRAGSEATTQVGGVIFGGNPPRVIDVAPLDEGRAIQSRQGSAATQGGAAILPQYPAAGKLGEGRQAEIYDPLSRSDSTFRDTTILGLPHLPALTLEERESLREAIRSAKDNMLSSEAPLHDSRAGSEATDAPKARLPGFPARGKLNEGQIHHPVPYVPMPVLSVPGSSVPFGLILDVPFRDMPILGSESMRPGTPEQEENARRSREYSDTLKRGDGTVATARTVRGARQGEFEVMESKSPATGQTTMVSIYEGQSLDANHFSATDTGLVILREGPFDAPTRKIIGLDCDVATAAKAVVGEALEGKIVDVPQADKVRQFVANVPKNLSGKACGPDEPEVKR